jgi:uncharacterized protein YciI
MTMRLEEFQLILLRRPASPRVYDDAETGRIQREHLAFYAGLRESGQVVTNGPVLDAADEALRGIAFFTVGSVDRARELAGTDPAVLAGRLEVEAMTWWCPQGTMARPGAPVTAGD